MGGIHPSQKMMQANRKSPVARSGGAFLSPFLSTAVSSRCRSFPPFFIRRLLMFSRRFFRPPCPNPSFPLPCLLPRFFPFSFSFLSVFFFSFLFFFFFFLFFFFFFFF